MTERSRRWLRILLAVLVAILLIGAGAIAWRVRQVDRLGVQLKREGITAYQRADGSPFPEIPIVGRVMYVLGGETIVSYGVTPGPPLTDAVWIRNVSRLRQLPPVTSICLRGSEVTRPSLATFGGFPALVVVSLEHCHIGDDDISALASNPRLRSLSLEDTAVTGTGLRSLAALETLWTLTLDGSPISEDGIDAISQLRQLKSLSLSNVGLAESEIVRLEEALPGVMISDD
jgi:hypothetical protein